MNDISPSHLIEQVTPQLLSKHDKAGPRYTSYPTAVEFHTGFRALDLQERLEAAGEKVDLPLSLYVHIPFCKKRCNFCGCNVVVGKNQASADRYLEHLFLEIEMVSKRLGKRKQVIQLHFGGGTPTFLANEQLDRLMVKIRSHFVILPEAEVAIEINPDTTSVDKLTFVRGLGFNRLSIGVQDFHPPVLDAVGRSSTKEQTQILLKTARTLGFVSINLDLIYGLPGQTEQSFGQTIADVVAIKPDRLAVYGFAYIPWVKPHQKKIDEAAIPGREEKFALFATAIKGLLKGGYLQIGMDHFALPSDEMGQALVNNRLFRNFMGYTIHRAEDMVGVGVSSISYIEGAFAQNLKKTGLYYKQLDAGGFPVEKGYVLSDDDHIRKWVITQLMCNFTLDFNAVETQFEIDFETYFKTELSLLTQSDGPVDSRFFNIHNKRLTITPLGRLFVRNICMIFDAYMQSKKNEKVFSKTV